MPTVLQFRRGTEAQNDAFVGAITEITYDTTNNRMRLHDGSTAGGLKITTVADVALANTNSAISNLNTNLTGTNTAIRSLVSTQTTRVDLVNTNLTSTNTALRTLISDRAQVANVAALAALANTNSYIASVQTDVDNNEATERAALANTNAYIATMLPKAGGQMTGNITFSGSQTVDGRDLSADGSKLDGIESGATADQSASEILTLIKTVDGAGSGLDADLLDGQSSAYYAVAATENSRLANTNTYIATKANIASPTFTGVPAAPTAAAATNTTQIATTAFVRTEVSNLVASAPSTLDTLNELAAALGDDPNFATTIASTYQTISTSKAYLANTNAYIATKLNSSSYTEADVRSKAALANTNAYIATMLPKAGGQMTGNITFSGSQTVDGRDLSADGSKLDGIESGATADQTAAEILTAIKTVDGAGSGLDADLLDGQSSAYYAVAATENSRLANTNTYIATMLPKAGGQMTGNITMSGAQTVDGRDLSVDGAKLDGIEAGATADQSASEILTLIKTVDGAGSGLDADLLDGVSSASFLRSDASDSFTSGTLTVGGTALDVNVDMTAAGNITMDGSSKLLTLNDNSLDEFTEYARPLANSGTAITLDVSDNTQLYTLTGNCTFTLPALSNYPSNSSKSITIVVKQDGTGGRTVAFSATDGYSINNSASVPAPASGASKVSIYTCIGIVELSEWFISLSYIDD